LNRPFKSIGIQFRFDILAFQSLNSNLRRIGTESFGGTKSPNSVFVPVSVKVNGLNGKDRKAPASLGTSKSAGVRVRRLILSSFDMID
jgi:hypothetical protein